MSITMDRATLQPVILCAVLAVVIAVFGGCARNQSLRGGSEDVDVPVKFTLKEKNIGIKDWERITNDDEEIPFTFKALTDADIGDKCAEKKDCSREQIEYEADLCKQLASKQSEKNPCVADLFIVEFDDQGRLYHKEQMERFFTFLTERMSPKPNCLGTPAKENGKYNSNPCFDDVSLVVAVHGWRHNASLKDKNLRELREVLYSALLIELDPRANHFSPSNKPRKVVGLYVGWRGSVLDEESLPWPLSYLTTVTALLSFWDRKGAAMDVALGATRELFARLGHLRAEVNKEIDNENTKNTRKRLGRESEWYTACMQRADKNNKCLPMRVLIVGHSFGSLVIYNSISESIIERVTEGIDVIQAEKCGQVESPHADLIVFINPAFEGTRFEPLYQASLNRIQKSCYPKSQAPVLVMLSGTTDRATESVFPKVRMLSTLFEANSPRDKDSTVIESVKQEEGDAMRLTVGHNPRYMTHYLDIFPSKEIDSTNLSNQIKHCLTTDWFDLTRSSGDPSSSAQSGTEAFKLGPAVEEVAREWRIRLGQESWPARAMCGRLRVSPASKEPVGEKDPLEDLPAQSESSGPWTNQLPPEYQKASDTSPNKRTRDPYNPIWIVRTKNERIIDGHNGYLNSNMVGFILQLYRDVLRGNSPGKHAQAK
jgi:hypothetical protein